MNGLYNVQLGDFRSREETELCLDKFKDKFEKDVWIINTLVHQDPPPALMKPINFDPLDLRDD
jgi:hypothetical protein